MYVTKYLTLRVLYYICYWQTKWVRWRIRIFSWNLWQ